MSLAPARIRTATPPTRDWWRLLPTPRIAVFMLALGIAALAVSGTGFGADNATVTPNANVIGTLSLTNPIVKDADPPVCTKQLAPLDTDACADATYAGGGAPSLQLGALSGADVQAARLTWKVSTSNPLGYVVHVRNADSGPLLHGSTGSIPDMQPTPMVPASAVDDATHAGIAVGDPDADNQASVSFPGSPWVTASGQQGELFRGVPTSSIVVAQRTSAQTNDPFSITLAAASVPASPVPAGSLSANLGIVVSAL